MIHLVISLAPGGLERLVVEWTNTRNRRMPGSTRIVCLDERGALADQVEGDAVICLNAIRSRRPLDFAAVRRLRQLLRDDLHSYSSPITNNPITNNHSPILHSHNAAAWQYAALACLGTKVRHVHTEHGTNPHYRGVINRLRTAVVRRLTDSIVAVSSHTADDLVSNHHIPRQEITVIANGVAGGGGSQDSEFRIQNSEVRKQLGLSPDAFVIGSVGRLAQVKGYDRLIGACGAVNGYQLPVNGRAHSSEGSNHQSPITNNDSLFTNNHLLLVGDGPERAVLTQQAQDAGLADRVIFAGYQDDPAPYLAAMDLFVLSSRSEGLSVALLEAMSAGIPVAVTDVGANREIIDNGACGVLLPDDEAKWAEVIREAMKDRDVVAARVEAGRQRVRMHYSLDATLDAYEQIYETGDLRGAKHTGGRSSTEPHVAVSDVPIPIASPCGSLEVRPPSASRRSAFSLITVTNLYPRPDEPTRGLYNGRLFGEMGNCDSLLVKGKGATTNNQEPITNNHVLNICLVPSWKIWEWVAIRRWTMPGNTAGTAPGKYPSPESSPPRGEERCRVPDDDSSPSPLRGEGWGEGGCGGVGRDLREAPSTTYLPVFTLPLLGRSINWWFYYRALRGRVNGYSASVIRGDPQGVFSDPNNQEPITNNHPIFYTPWLYPDGVAVARAIRGTSARLWLMALGSDTFHLKSTSRRRRILEACEQAEGIVCVAQVLADRLAEAGVPRAKLHVVPNGVDSSLFRVRNKEELLVNGYSLSVNSDAELPNNQEPLTNNGPAEGGTILFVGNLVPVKGPDILLRAFASLSGQDEARSTWRANPAQRDEPNGEPKDRRLTGDSTFGSAGASPSRCFAPDLILIGDGPMRAQLERLSRDLGIADRVHFLGRRPPEEVVSWMNEADCLCLPSRSEGMPNVVLEARACGLPVVATPAGAIPELPLDREHFLVTPACTPEDLAAGLRDMLGCDLGARKPDPAIPTWGQMAGTILGLIEEGGEGGGRP